MVFFNHSLIICLSLSLFFSLNTMEQNYHFHSDPQKEFVYAAYHGNLEVLKAALAKGVPVDVLPFGDQKNMFASETALFLAVKELSSDHHLPMIKYLLDHGANPNIPNRDLVTPLMVASNAWDFNDVEKIRMLLAKGAEVNEADKAGHTALYRAQRTLNSPANNEEYRRGYSQRAATIVAMLREKGALEINKEKII